MNDDCGRRQIEEDDRGQPEQDVRGSLFRRDSDPGKADDEKDLSEGEIGKAELLAELGTLRFDGRDGRLNASSSFLDRLLDSRT